MTRLARAGLLGATATLALGLAGHHGLAAEGDSVAPVLWQPSMNVFRRHAVPAADMYAFYGDVLGLRQLTTLSVGNGGVARFQAGASELKFTGRVAGRQYHAGGVRDATGFRLLTLFYPDADALTARFAAHDLPLPEFDTASDGSEARALVQDPDGQWVELVVVPEAPPSVYQQIEVGLTVSDLAASRAFYGEFVGLDSLGSKHDERFGTAAYSYRHGSTIVTLRSFDTALPADTGSGGIQYVVSDVDRVDALAKQRRVSVDQPLSTLANFSLRTVWLEDPDGITNYFAETSASRAAAAP